MSIILDIAEAYNGSLPPVRAQWVEFLTRGKEKGYAPMKLTTFRGHVKDLVKEDLIRRKKGVIFIPNSKWKAPKNLRRLLN